MRNIAGNISSKIKCIACLVLCHFASALSVPIIYQHFPLQNASSFRFQNWAPNSNVQFLGSLSIDPKELFGNSDHALLPRIHNMSQVQTCRHVDATLQPRPDSWISLNDINDLTNREMGFVKSSSTSSEDLWTQTNQHPHLFHGTNHPHNSGHLVSFKRLQINPSTPPHAIISGKDMDSAVEVPFRGQLVVCGQPSPSSHPNLAIQTRDGSQVVNVAVDPHRPVYRDLPLPNRRPTAEDWQAYRNIFTQLYKVENKTLKDVMGVMREQYHFRARRVSSILILIFIFKRETR
jgi:hypothetical protein